MIRKKAASTNDGGGNFLSITFTYLRNSLAYLCLSSAGCREGKGNPYFKKINPFYL